MPGSLARLARGTVIYGGGNLLNKLLTFMLVPIFTRYLRPEDYGIVAMLALLNMVVAGIFSLGTINSLGICYFGEEKKEERGRVIWTTAGIIAISCAFWLTIASMTAPVVSRLLLDDPARGDLVLLSLATLALNTLSAPFTSYLRLEERALTFVKISLVGAVLTLILNIVAVVYLGKGVRGMLEATLVAAAVSLLLSFATVLRDLHPRWGANLVAPLLKIGYPSIFGLGAFFMIDWADRFFLQRLVGVAEVGVYSVGYTIGMVMALIAEGTFGSAWPPFFMSFITRRDEAIAVFGGILKYCVFAFGALTAMFFLFARPVVVLLTAPPYHEAYTVVGMIAAAYMLKACYLILLPALYFEKKLHIQTGVEWGAALLNAGLCLLLIPIFRMRGAAAATVISYMALPTLTYFIARRYLPVRHEWGKIAGFGAVIVVSAALSAVLAHLPVWGHIVFAVFISAGIVFVTYHRLLSTSERAVVARYSRLALSRASFAPSASS
jgi:O-antigen/teichoic acid export membrane protein